MLYIVVHTKFDKLQSNKKSTINKNVITVFVGHLSNDHKAGITCTSVYLCSTIEVRNLLMLHKQSPGSNKI